MNMLSYLEKLYILLSLLKDFYIGYIFANLRGKARDFVDL